MDGVKGYMSEPSVIIDAESSVLDTVKLMKESKVGAILVTENGEITGIFTETDLLRKVAADEKSMGDIKVSSVMSKPLVSIDVEAKMLKAFYEMQQRNIRHLTVTEDEIVVGILSIKDIANFYIGKFGQKAGKVPKENPSKDEAGIEEDKKDEAGIEENKEDKQE